MIDQSFWHGLSILGGRDVAEILVFSTGIYLFCLWLKKDHSYRLIGSFYAACALFLSAWAFQLQTLLTVFQMAWPALIVLFLIVHRQQLQKNYVNYKSIKPARKTGSQDWIATVMRATLMAAHNKRALIFVIEGNTALDELLEKGVALASPMSTELMDMIITSQTTHENSIIWIDQAGHLVAINCHWKRPVEAEWLTGVRTQLPAWEQEALFWTHNNDALVLHACPQSHALTIIAKSTRVPDITGDDAHTIVSQYLRKMSLPKYAQEKAQ